MSYFALLYDVVDGFADKRMPHRPAHLEQINEAHTCDAGRRRAVRRLLRARRRAGARCDRLIDFDRVVTHHEVTDEFESLRI